MVLRGAASSITIRIGGVALSYAATVLLSRLLGASEYGKYAIALSWVLVLSLFAKAGFDNSSLRYATVYLERGEGASLRAFIRFAAGAIIGISVVIGALIMIAGGRFAAEDRGLLIWTALMVPPLALLAFYSVLMRTAHRIVASQFYDQILRPLFIILAIGALSVSRVSLDARTALMVTTLAAAGALAVLWLHFRAVFAKSMAARPDYEPWREWLAVSVPMLLMGVVQELMNHIDVILLGLLANASQAGVFAVSWRLASLVPFVFVGLSVMAAPLIASANDRKSRDEMFRIAALVARVGFGFAVIASLILFVAGKWLLHLFGNEFVLGVPVLSVLLIGGLVNAFTGVAGYLMILTGHERQSLTIFVGALLLSIVLNLLLIPKYGALGAAMASSVATAAWNLAMLVYVRRVMGIDASAIAFAPRASSRT